MSIITNIFIAVMLTTIIVGADIANSQVEVVEAKEEIEKVEKEAESTEIVSIERLPKEPERSVEEIILDTFGDEAPNAIKMLTECENKTLNPKAVNWNRNGTWDAGIFQINQVHGYTKEQLLDPEFNTQVAYKIFQNRGWSAWTCSYILGVKSFWQK